MVRLLVPVHQGTLYVGGPVQDSAAYLDIGQYAVVSVILKAPAADLQSDGQFLVGVIAFPVQGRLVVFTYFLHLFRKVFQRREESSHAYVVFRCKQPDIAIVIHKSDICLFVGWLVGWLACWSHCIFFPCRLLYTVSFPPRERRPSRPPACKYTLWLILV